MGNKQSSANEPSFAGRDLESTRPAEPPSSSSLNGSNSNPSYYALIKNSYQQLVNAIIRPPRCKYTIEQLGPKQFSFCGKRFQRTDFTLTNPRNLKFECSLWEPTPDNRHSERLPCVIYMHGNSSARIEALTCLSVVLGMGATLLAMDFAGSGLSEGEYVSLGAFEKDDLAAAIEYLRNSDKTSTIALWGRSMGAATALLHAERDPSIAGMVLDSAFSDLVILAEDMVEKGRQQGLFAPSFLVYVAIKFVRSSVQKAANFDIKTLSPIEHADRCFVPALFIAAENDQFVLPRHSQSIHEKYGGDKNLVLVEGDHNSPRPRYLYDSIAIFLQQTLQLPPSWVLPGSEYYVRRLPWSSSTMTAAAMSSPHPQRSIVTLSEANVAGSERQRLESYIARQQQLQTQSGTRDGKLVMYESDHDEDEGDKEDGRNDIASLMNGNESGLTADETDMLMLQMMDEDEQLALALEESISDARRTMAPSDMAAVQATQNEGEKAMQANVEQSLFSLLGGGGGGGGGTNNNNNNNTKATVTTANNSGAAREHRPLGMTKEPHRHHDSTPLYEVHEVRPQSSTAPVAISSSAVHAAEMLLQQQNASRSPPPLTHSASGDSDLTTSNASPTNKKHFFFAEDGDSHPMDSALNEDSNNKTTQSSSTKSTASATSPRSFPTAVLPTSPTAKQKMSALSSFHTFHTVFDQFDNDQLLRQASLDNVSSSSIMVPASMSTDATAGAVSHRPTAVSASQILNMADPFDDEIEEEVEVVDERGNKRKEIHRRKKVDEFADNNEVPIPESEIVGMEETLEELSYNLGSGSAEFWSKLSSKNGSKQSSQRNLSRYSGTSNNSSFAVSLGHGETMTTTSNGSATPSPASTIPSDVPNDPSSASLNSLLQPLGQATPIVSQQRQPSVSHAELLLMGGDEDD